MIPDDTHFTVGKTTFLQGENQTHPCSALRPASLARTPGNWPRKMMGYLRELTINGLKDGKPMMIWTAHCLSAMV